MKPIELKLSGIYSYRTEQTIDFNKLSQARIFGIFGGVGSGKSTILEAMTFVLYKKAERVNNNEFVKMIHLSSEQMRIELTFEAGVTEQNRYRFVITAKRHKKKRDTIDKTEWLKYVEKNGEWIPNQNLEASQIIGLSYENFSKTVIIPQGKFQEFLQLGKAERNNMLCDIFSLHRFELGNRVSSQKIKTNLEIEKNLGVLSELVDISPESLTEKQAELQKTQEKANRARASLSQKRLERESLDRIAEDYQMLLNERESLKKLDEKATEISKKQEEITLYEECFRNFKDIIAHYHQSLSELKETQKEALDLDGRIAQLKAESDETEERHRELQALYEKSAERAKSIDNLKKSLEISQLRRDFKGLEQALSNKGQILQGITENINQLKSQLDQKEKEIVQIIEQSADFPKLSRQLSLLDKQNTLLESRNALQKALAEDRKTLNQMMESLKERLNPMEFTENLSDNLSRITERKSQIRNELQILALEHNHLSVMDKLSHYASELKDGAPCPLCGSTHHPNITPREDVESSLQKNLENQNRLNKEMQNLELASQAVLEVLTRASEMEKIAQKSQSQIEEIKATLENIKIEGGDSLLDEQTLRKRYLECEGFQEKMRLKSAEKNHIEQAQNKERENETRLSRELEEIRLSKSQLEGQIQALTAQVSPEETVVSPKDAEDKIATMEREQKQIESDFKQSQEEKTRRRILYEKHTAQLESITRALSKLHEELKNQKREIESRLDGSRLQSIEEIEGILSKGYSQTELESLKEEIHTYQREYEKLSESIRERESRQKDSPYSPSNHQAVQQEEETLNKEYETLSNQSALFQSECKQIEEKLSKKTEINKKSQALQRRLDLLKILDGLLRGNGFVEYIATKYMRQICHIANDRYQKLNQNRYRLEFSDESEIVIRDFLNEGKTRSFKTLSGGQTFQVSLCLALAISSLISARQNINQNFFFLDEGFGTLDNESLSMVFETLRSLGEENRLVGLISHLDSIKNEIDTHITVTLTENYGSIIKPSWQ